MTPTQRTMKYLRDRGFLVAVVERWNSFAKIRQDLFGFGDIVAVKSNIWAIQTTSGDNHAKRRAKILDNEAAKVWLEVGGKIAVISWSKCGERGKRKLWTPRTEEITQHMIREYQFQGTKA